MQSKKKRKRPCRPAMAAAQCSSFVLVELTPSAVGMFRFLLEAYDHLAYFSVLNRHTALLQVFYSPHQEGRLHEVLVHIGRTLQQERGAQMRLTPRPTLHSVGGGENSF